MEGIPQRNKVEGHEVPPNVVELDTENAHYHIVYGNHILPEGSETAEKSDGIILEWMYGDEDLEAGAQRAMDTVQYGDIVREARKNKKPLFLVDVLGSKELFRSVSREYVINSILLPIVGGVVGGKLVESSVDEKLKPQTQITRRAFISKTLKAIIGGYLLTPVAEALLSLGEAPEDSSIRNAERKLSNLNDKIHPELESFGEHGRNTLIAQKSESVARLLAKEKGKRPSLSLVVGAAHFGVEDEFRKQEEERIQSLKKDLGEHFEGQGVIVRIDFEDEVVMQEDGAEKTESRAKVTILSDPAFNSSV